MPKCLYLGCRSAIAFFTVGRMVRHASGPSFATKPGALFFEYECKCFEKSESTPKAA